MAKRRRRSGQRTTPMPRAGRRGAATSSTPRDGDGDEDDDADALVNPPEHDLAVADGDDVEDGDVEDGDVEDGDEVAPGPRWGMGDMVVWFIVSQVAATLALFAVASAQGYSFVWPTGPGAVAGEVSGRLGAGLPLDVTRTVADLPLSLTTLLQVPLWLGFVGGPLFVTFRKGARSLATDFGLTVRPRIDIPLGVAVGVVTQLVVVPILYFLLFQLIGEQDVSEPARALTAKATDGGTIVLLLLIVGVGAPIAEELFFRGLSQRAIARRLGAGWGVVLSALFFAFAHGQPVQFPALLLFGIILGYLANRFGRLGPSIFAHAAFNLVAALTLIFDLNLW